MMGNDYKLLIAMDDELKGTLQRSASQSGKTLSAFVRESVKERVETLEDLKDRETTQGSSVSQKLGDVWRMARRSALCRFLLNAAIAAICIYIYATVAPIR
jgi:hypothetical protein